MSKLNELLGDIPLSVRVKVAIEFYFIEKYNGSLFISHDKDGKEINNPNNIKAMKEARPIIDLVLKEIEEYENK